MGEVVSQAVIPQGSLSGIEEAKRVPGLGARIRGMPSPN